MAPESLANWVGAALRHAGMEQAELARNLSAALRQPYDRSKVNKMLAGTRKVQVPEVLAIEQITGHPAPIGISVARVPILDWVSAGKLVPVASQVSVEEAPRIVVGGLGHGDFFALRVEGDSMDRISPEGSIIIVNRADRALDAGRPYVFWVDGEATYKLWQPDPPRLEPHSWAAHKTRFLKGMKGLEVIGRVKRSILEL